MSDTVTFQMHDDGKIIDACLVLRPVNGKQFQIILESSGSGNRSKGIARRNPEYKIALETLLKRISTICSSLDDCVVASKNLLDKGLTLDERRVPPSGSFSYPIQLSMNQDFNQLRLALTGPQAGVGSSAKNGGGNSTKRILLTFSSREEEISREEILKILNAEPIANEDLSRPNVLDGINQQYIDLAIGEWRRIGAGQFHQKYNTNSTSRYVIVDFDGMEFDVHAVCEGAQRFAADNNVNLQLSRDQEFTETSLIRLGFIVEDLELRDEQLSLMNDVVTPMNRDRAIEVAKKFCGRTDELAVRSVRREQRTLRWALGLGAGQNLCSICGREFPDKFLVAAHIKKRSECDEDERVDIPSVALIACTFGCDALFEHGYISVDELGKIISLKTIPNTNLGEAINGLVGRKIGVDVQRAERYLRWHREYWGRSLVFGRSG